MTDEKYHVEVKDARGVVIGDQAKVEQYFVEKMEAARPLEIPPPPEPTRPPETAAFVGRETELAYFADRVATSHLAVITGMAGVGKTALAAALARRVTDPEKTFWHSFHEGEGVDVIIWKLAGFLAWHGQEDLWRMLQSAQQTGGQTPPPEVLFDYLIQMISGRGYLLCFDDFQHVDDDPLLEQLVERLRTEVLVAGVFSLIITSRRMPDFVQTVEFETLAGLRLADTHMLLMQRGLSLPDDLVSDLHTHTGGNAQFLTLASDALQHAEDPARLIAQLSETEDMERYLMSEVDEGLTEDERAVMSGVAVLLGYPGPGEAIEAILDRGSVRRTLRDLSSRHLLTVSEGETSKEYGQHAIVQTFYYDLLGRRQRRVMHRRAGEYYESEETDALKAGLHFERAGQYERSARLIATDIWSMINRGQARALKGLLERFTVQQMDTMQWAQVNLARGQVYSLVGERQLAQSSYQEALSQLAALGDSPHMCELKARTCRGMGDLLQHESPSDALDWYRRGLDKLAGSSTSEEAALHIQIGSVQIGMGDYDSALQALERGMSLLPEEPSQLYVSALTNLGTIYYYRGDTEKGNEYTLRGLEISRQLHDRFRMTTILGNVAIDKFVAGDWEGAVTACLQALALAEQLGSHKQQAQMSLNLGTMYVKMGDSEAALASLSDSLELARKGNLREYEALIQSSLTELYLAQGETAAASKSVTEAERLVLAMDTQWQLPEIYRLWARTHLAEGRPALALDFAERAVNLARDMEMDLEEGISLRILGQALLANGQHESAINAFERSLSLLADRDPYEAARTKMQWGMTLLLGGDADGAAVLLQEARTTFQQLGARHDLASADRILYNDICREERP